MTIYTKCIYSLPLCSDGLRISVMSRHTLSDGETPDSFITSAKYDIHLPLLSPRNVRKFLRKEMDWEEYEANYLTYLRRGDISNYVKSLATSALQADFTFLCQEASPQFCHRRVLAEECKRLIPSIDIKVF